MFAQEYGVAATTEVIAASTDQHTASESHGIWLGSGVLSITSGLLLVVGHLVDLGSPAAYGAVLGKSLILAAHLFLVLALVGIYAAQAGRMRLLGHLGMVLSVLGTALVTGVVLVEVAGAAGAEVEAVLAGGVAGMLAMLAGLSFFVGVILFGIATARAGVFPRWASIILIAGDLVFAASTSAGAAAPIVTIAGAALTGVGFGWLGLVLIARTRATAAAT